MALLSRKKTDRDTTLQMAPMIDVELDESLGAPVLAGGDQVVFRLDLGADGALVIDDSHRDGILATENSIPAPYVAGVEHDVIKKSGTWMSFGEVRIGQGRERARDFLEENPDLQDELKTAILQKLEPAPKEEQPEEEQPQPEQEVAAQT